MWVTAFATATDHTARDPLSVRITLARSLKGELAGQDAARRMSVSRPRQERATVALVSLTVRFRIAIRSDHPFTLRMLVAYGPPVRVWSALVILLMLGPPEQGPLFRSRVGPPANAPQAVPFDLRASGLGIDAMIGDAHVGLPSGTRQRRKYRRSPCRSLSPPCQWPHA